MAAGQGTFLVSIRGSQVSATFVALPSVGGPTGPPEQVLDVVVHGVQFGCGHSGVPAEQSELRVCEIFPIWPGPHTSSRYWVCGEQPQTGGGGPDPSEESFS